ncbi:MAG: YnbE family lipoprotein [Kiloniellales bacterium]
MYAKSHSSAIAPGRQARIHRIPGLAVLLVAAALTAACQPTVKVEAPKDPITINLNIQADVRVTLEEKAKEDISANPGVF